MNSNWIVIPIYCLGLVAEIVGGVGVYRAAFSLRRLRETPFMTTNEVEGTFTINDAPVDAVIRAQDQPWLSLVMLGVGIVAGFAGNVLSTVLPKQL